MTVGVPLTVYVVVRGMEWHAIYDTSEYAQFEADRLNDLYPRGKRYAVIVYTVRRDPAA